MEFGLRILCFKLVIIVVVIKEMGLKVYQYLLIVFIVMRGKRGIGVVLVVEYEMQDLSIGEVVGVGMWEGIGKEFKRLIDQLIFDYVKLVIDVWVNDVCVFIEVVRIKKQFIFCCYENGDVFFKFKV